MILVFWKRQRSGRHQIISCLCFFRTKANVQLNAQLKSLWSSITIEDNSIIFLLLKSGMNNSNVGFKETRNPLLNQVKYRLQSLAKFQPPHPHHNQVKYQLEHHLPIQAKIQVNYPQAHQLHRPSPVLSLAPSRPQNPVSCLVQTHQKLRVLNRPPCQVCLQRCQKVVSQAPCLLQLQARS